MLLTRSPLIQPNKSQVFSVRLACVKHAASVRPEPGSNSLFKVRLLSLTFLLHLNYCFSLYSQSSYHYMKFLMFHNNHYIIQHLFLVVNTFLKNFLFFLNVFLKVIKKIERESSLFIFLSVFVFFSFVSPYIMTWFNFNHLWFIFRVIMLFWIVDF